VVAAVSEPEILSIIGAVGVITIILTMLAWRA